MGSRTPTLRRVARVVVAAWLLLFGQAQLLAHPYTHVVLPHDAALTAPQGDAPCVECELLAAGAGVAPASPPSHAAVRIPHVVPAATAAASPAADAAAWFESRAPPQLP